MRENNEEDGKMNQTGVEYMYIWKYHDETPHITIIY
jgi:hypothetical protein